MARKTSTDHEATRKKWGLPDWRRGSEYRLWRQSTWVLRWEFLRRTPDYRRDWQKKTPRAAFKYHLAPANLHERHRVPELIDPATTGIEPVFDDQDYRDGERYLRLGTISYGHYPVAPPSRPSGMTAETWRAVCQESSRPRLREGLVQVTFDMRSRLSGQFKRAYKSLREYQEGWLEKERARLEATDGKPPRHSWIALLRALDADLQNADRSEIWRTIYPRRKSGNPSRDGDRLVNSAISYQARITRLPTS
jgi:hypothetical protein